MTMGTLIPYGNSAWFRWLLGWLLPPQMSFLKSSHTAETREASIRKQVYQDVCFPAAELDAGQAAELRMRKLGCLLSKLMSATPQGGGYFCRLPACQKYPANFLQNCRIFLKIV